MLEPAQLQATQEQLKPQARPGSVSLTASSSELHRMDSLPVLDIGPWLERQHADDCQVSNRGVRSLVKLQSPKAQSPKPKAPKPQSPETAGLQALCQAVADALVNTGCLVIRDPRVGPDDSDVFLDQVRVGVAPRAEERQV